MADEIHSWLERKPPRWVWVLLAVALACFLTVCMSGCAVGEVVNPDGSKSYVIGTKLNPWSGGQVGQAVTGILGALGVPGATAIGTGVTGIIGLLGLGGVKVAGKLANARAEAAELRGKESGWLEREQAAAVQLPLPPAGGAGVNPTPAQG